MLMPETYRGREQTFIKHVILERYLEGVAYRLLSTNRSDFVYVDGFSGPWKSRDENYEDTSFGIAIRKLRSVVSKWESQGKVVKVRCLFIEKDPVSFRALQTAVSQVKDIQVQALHGEFEERISEVIRFIGSSFALVFIDPTGWTGFDFSKIGPLLTRRPGEVLVNFMYDHINRFIEHPDPQIQASLAPLFGGPGWQDRIRTDIPREAALVELFREGLKQAGQFSYALSTPISKSTADRSHFYLCYGTRHPKGLEVFREVERTAMQVQVTVREQAKQNRRVEKTGQVELFGAPELPPAAAKTEREQQHELAREFLLTELAGSGSMQCQTVLVLLMERFTICVSEVNRLLLALRSEGTIEIDGLKPPKRSPAPEHVIIYNGSRSRECHSTTRLL